MNCDPHTKRSAPWPARLRRLLPSVLLAIATPAAAVPTLNWLDYTLIAQDRLDIGANLNLTGNFAVTAAGGSLEIGLNSFQLDGAPTPFMAGDTIHLGPQASIVDAYTNQLTGSPSGMVRGQILSQSFPILLDTPPFPSSQVCEFCALGAPDVVVDPDDTITLDPGCYGELFARAHASVFLQPGSYTFREWDIQKFATVTADGPVQIHVRDKISTEESNFFGSSSGEPLDFQVWIGSARSCHATAKVKHSAIGKFSLLIGTFVAPEDDDLNFNRGAVLVGTAMAREIDVRGSHDARPPTPTPSPTPTPTPTSTPTPTPPSTPTPTPPSTPTPTPPSTPTPTPPSGSPTPTPSVTPTPNVPTPTPTQPFVPPSPTPEVSPTPDQTPTPKPTSIATPTPTQPFVPPTPTATRAPRKHPWGKRSGLIESLFPSRKGPKVNPSMRRPLSVRRR